MKHLIPIVALIVFLTFVVGVNIYLSRRFSWYFGISHINRLYIAFALGSVFMIGGLMVFTNSVSPSWPHSLYGCFHLHGFYTVSDNVSNTC